MEPRPTLLLEGRVPISSYGDGGFQFAGRSHAGNLIILPDAIYAWEFAWASFDEVTFFRFLDENKKTAGDFILLGTGVQVNFPSASFRSAIDLHGLGLEIMATGAACRTYNVLLAEGRLFTTGLLPS